MVEEISSAARIDNPDSSGPFCSKKLQKPIMLAIAIAMFNQLSGTNAIQYFAPRIFENAGIPSDDALLMSIGLGATNFIFTFAGVVAIDRVGRRTLMYIGSFGYIISLGLISWSFQSESFSF